MQPWNPLPSRASVRGLLPLLWSGAVMAGFLLLPVSLRAQSKGPPAQDDIFEGTSLLRIALQISEAGINTLRGSQAAQNPQTKPSARATVIEGGRVYKDVSVQLKGFSSFQPIDRTPSFTLNFDKFVPKQKFHGLEKISLNNSSQDPTRLHEIFSRELFAAAGVPVPRATHALVSLNGRELGLYVLAEGYDKEFLRRHFVRADGTLYEGGTLQDITQGLRLSSGTPANPSGVQRLIRAAREPDPEKRFPALEAALDMERFLSMVAMETILCHSDSYSMNKNNYRLYHDPTTDKMVFMPHGMDRVLGTHRSSLDLSLVPPRLGLVARALLTTTEGRRRYIERAGVLFTNLFQPDRLCRRAREIGGRLSSSRSTADLCARISTRAAELQLQFTDLPFLLALTPHPKFDASGSARIDGWRPTPKAGQPKVSSEMDARNEREILHLRATGGPLITTVRSRLSLPAGTYRISGQVRVKSDALTNSVPVSVSIVRAATSRFGYEQQRLMGNDVNFSFQVSDARAPEEIEFTCEVRSPSPEAWFDAGSLQLLRTSR